MVSSHLPRLAWLLVCTGAPLFLVADNAKAAPVPPPAPATIDFNRQILPLLSEHCFACHGPDQKQRKAGLRLDIRDGAFGKLRSGDVAIVAGKPDKSELVARISSTEASEIMPPPGKGKPLSAAQVALLKQWVQQGANWSAHWAYLVPRKAALPGYTARVGRAIQSTTSFWLALKRRA